MTQNMEDRTELEWLELLTKYEALLKAKVDEGCGPSEYRALSELKHAVSIVIHRLRNSNVGGRFNGV